MSDTLFRANCPGCFYSATLEDEAILRKLARNHARWYDCDPDEIELEEVKEA